jgi:uncharacterized membrane protein YqjE
MHVDGNGRRAFGTLVRDLVDETVALVRGEARLAKLEASRAASAIGRGSAFVALGSAFLILGALTLLIGVIMLIGDQWLPADLYWLAALIVLIITGGIAALFAARGRARLTPSQLAPVDTAATLKENVSWVKQQLKSGTTSR